MLVCARAPATAGAVNAYPILAARCVRSVWSVELVRRVVADVVVLSGMSRARSLAKGLVDGRLEEDNVPAASLRDDRYLETPLGRAVVGFARYVDSD